MTSALGTFGLLLGLGSAIGLVWYAWQAAQRGSREPAQLRWAAAGLVAGAGLAFVALEVAILRDDFSVKFVADHSARSTPLLFKVATGWAALEGSLVLWALILSGYTLSVVGQHRRRNRAGPAGPDRLGAGALVVMGLVATFFFAMLATFANPFRTISPVPLDGPGPNPLLQNHVLMAVHPPLLYLGYVGFTVPFAFAVSALALGEQGPAWVRRTQWWALLAWSFLTAGIVGGAWWSYEVLGWGGYWAWDPVENASFLPWLLGTAYLHSATVQARRGVLKAWSVALILGTFALTILGTFLTRSGVVASVHSFSQSAIGPALLGFLGVVVLGSFGLFAARAHLVSSPTRLESLASREGAFLLNNLLLAVFALVVLTGTVYPLLVEAFSGQQLSVGRPFFDRLAVPLAFALLLAMGIGAVIPYRVGRPGLVWRRLRVPVVVALLLALVAVSWFDTPPGVTVVVLLAGLIVVSAGAQLAGATRRQGSLAGVLVGDPGYWGGQVAHVGFAVLAVGIACSSVLGEHQTVTIDRGAQAGFGGYTITYDGPFEATEPNRTVTGADLRLSRGGDALATMRPKLAEFRNQVQAVGTPAVWSDLRGDEVYASLVSVDASSVTVTLYRFPLVMLVWAGGILTALGGVAGLVLRGVKRRRAARGRSTAGTPAAGTPTAGTAADHVADPDATSGPGPDATSDPGPTPAPTPAGRSGGPWYALVAVGLVVLLAVSQAAATPRAGNRSDELASRLRCPVCQGESVADSPARTAQAIRELIDGQVEAGRSDQEILDFFRARYGDWILLDPAVDRRTWPLWVLPGVALAGGLVLIARRRDPDFDARRDTPDHPTGPPPEPQPAPVDVTEPA